MPMPGATANGSFAYRPISKVIVKQMITVAVSTPLKAMPVLPSAEMICGLTTTMYDIVKKVVMPAMASVFRLGLAAAVSFILTAEWLLDFFELDRAVPVTASHTFQFAFF